MKSLEKALMERRAKVIIGPNGAVAFTGDWQNRSGINDACAYRKLASEGSFALRSAVMAAEAASGKKVNEQAIAAGYHTHDGKVWGKD